MTDRQRHVRRASFDIMFRSAYQHKSVVNRSPLFIYLFISSKFPAVGPWQACRVVFCFFFPKEEAVESIWRSECVFFPFFFFKWSEPEQTLYLLLLRQLKGDPRWHLVEQPCQLFVCIANGSGRCFSSCEDKRLITTGGPSGTCVTSG